MAFSVPPVTRSPGAFSAGIGSPVTIDSSTALCPSRTTPSTGTFSPGRMRRRVSDPHLADRHIALLAVPDYARRSRSQAEELLQGRACSATRAQLQHLAEQHQRRNDGRRIEVRLDDAMHAKSFGKQTRRDGGDRAVHDTPRQRPCAISVNMFGLRFTIEAHPRAKNGQPAHSTTGVAKRQADPVHETHIEGPHQPAR